MSGLGVRREYFRTVVVRVVIEMTRVWFGWEDQDLAWLRRPGSGWVEKTRVWLG